MPRKYFHLLHGVALFRKRPRKFCTSQQKECCLRIRGLLISAAQTRERMRMDGRKKGTICVNRRGKAGIKRNAVQIKNRSGRDAGAVSALLNTFGTLFFRFETFNVAIPARMVLHCPAAAHFAFDHTFDRAFHPESHIHMDQDGATRKKQITTVQ